MRRGGTALVGSLIGYVIGGAWAAAMTEPPVTIQSGEGPMVFTITEVETHWQQITAMNGAVIGGLVGLFVGRR